MGEYMLDQGDVVVIDYAETCAECDENPATKAVVVDFRSAGQQSQISGPLCADCAEEMAKRIKSGLPPEKTDHSITQMEAKIIAASLPANTKQDSECFNCGQPPSAPVHDAKYGGHPFLAEG